MKKISLLLAVVMLMSCVFSLTSCKETRPGKEGESEATEELGNVSGSKSDTDYSVDAQKFGNMSAEEITFGNYNGEDIVWIVLEKGNSGTLLLSKWKKHTIFGEDLSRKAGPPAPIRAALCM